MKAEVNIEKLFLITNMMNLLLSSYDNSGHTRPNYYNNIILPDLDESQLKNLHEIAQANFK